MSYKKNTKKEIRSSDYIVFLTDDTVSLKNKKTDLLKTEGFSKSDIKIIEPYNVYRADPLISVLFILSGFLIYFIKKYFILNPVLSYIINMGLFSLIISFPLFLFISYRKEKENEKEALIKFERVFGNFKKNPVLYNDYLKNYLNGGILIAGIKTSHNNKDTEE